jgi:hypothetical protein
LVTFHVEFDPVRAEKISSFNKHMDTTTLGMTKTSARGGDAKPPSARGSARLDSARNGPQTYVLFSFIFPLVGLLAGINIANMRTFLLYVAPPLSGKPAGTRCGI